MTTPEFPDLLPAKVIDLASQYKVGRIAPCTSSDGHEWVWEETTDEVLYQRGLCLNGCEVLVARKNPVFEDQEPEFGEEPPEEEDEQGEAAASVIPTGAPHTCPYCGADRSKAGGLFSELPGQALGTHKRLCLENPKNKGPAAPPPTRPSKEPRVVTFDDLRELSEKVAEIQQAVLELAGGDLAYLRGWQAAAREFIDAWKQLP